MPRHITSAPCLSHWHWVTILLMWIYRIISCIYIAGQWIPLWLAEGHKKVGRQISGRGQGSSVTDVDDVEFVTRLVRVKLVLAWLLKPRNYPFGAFCKTQVRFLVLFSNKKKMALEGKNWRFVKNKRVNKHPPFSICCQKSRFSLFPQVK